MLRHLPLALALAACDPDEPAPPVRPEAALRRLTSCEDLRATLEDALVEQIVQGRYGWWGWAVAEDAETGADDAPSSPSDYTGTNVQEAGVDEIDLVKTDGTHMYLAQDRALHVLSSWPPDQTEKLATVDLAGWATGLFLAGDRVIVVSYVDSESDPTLAAFTDGWAVTRAQILDVSDPAHPRLEGTFDFEGWVTDARMIGDQVYLVIDQWTTLPEAVWTRVWSASSILPSVPWDAPEADRLAAEAAGRALVRPLIHDALADLDPATIAPRFREAVSPGEPLVACDDLYATSTPTHLAMLSVVRVDLGTLDVDATGILSDGWTVYASADHLYVAQTSWWWWGWEDEGATHIHRFALEDDGPRYVASGEISGWIYDQFAMSEYEGRLRVATTDFGGWWWGPADPDAEPPANNVYVLEDDGQGALTTVGHVGGIAPGEQIRAARMIGDKGYLVTFRQTDPLFTLDLSDPTAPTVVGELVMPGFSSYLHPMDDDHLLAVGMQGLDTGELTGLAVSIFDVSDLADPRLVQQYALSEDGWAWSEAMWDHHAFTWHRDVLTLPAFFERWDDELGAWSGFSGAIVLSASVEGGISELGRVDHHDLVEASDCLYDRWWGWGDEVCAYGGSWWYAQVRRSVYIEDNLYTISDYGVKVNELMDPSVEIGRVVLFPR